nr:Ankyrin repeat domain containing protein [Pandoravirus aubagnensis]
MGWEADKRTDPTQTVSCGQCTWPTLPTELRREIIMRWLPDRDVGACLLAGRSFHALTARDLERRCYAYATVEGMCAAGDLRGLQYALGGRIETAPIDWAMCMHVAAIRGHVHIITWVVDQVGPTPGLDDDDWEDVYALATGSQPLLRPLATMRCVSANLLQQKDASRTIVAFERTSNMWTHSTPKARDAAVASCQRDPWAGMGSRLMQAIPIPSDINANYARDLTDAVVEANRDEQQCRARGDLRGAERHAETLATSGIRVVWALVFEGRLDEAVSVVSNPSTLEGHCPWTASATRAYVAKACALANERALVETMCHLIDACTCKGHYAKHERATLVRGAAQGGHFALLKYALVCWPGVWSDAVAEAVKGGHVDCVRWMCSHKFPTAASVIWCPVRAAYVSALTLAVRMRRDDMVALLVGAPDALDAIRLAFDDAVGAGDLRTARLIRALSARHASLCAAPL